MSTISPILQKCSKLPADQKLVSKLLKFGISLQEENGEEIHRTTPTITIPPTISMSTKLPRDFFARHPVDVARELLGKTLNFGEIRGVITETEAYAGLDDEASHAFKGPTQRWDEKKVEMES